MQEFPGTFSCCREVCVRHKYIILHTLEEGSSEQQEADV